MLQSGLPQVRCGARFTGTSPVLCEEFPYSFFPRHFRSRIFFQKGYFVRLQYCYEGRAYVLELRSASVYGRFYHQAPQALIVRPIARTCGAIISQTLKGNRFTKRTRETFRRYSYRNRGLLWAKAV